MRREELRLVSAVGKTFEIAPAEQVLLKPRRRAAGVLDFIRSARTSLLLSVFRCDDLGVLHELGEAAARGVRVEALMTGRAKGWGKRLDPLAGCLERLGVVIHRLNGESRKYHAKYLIADGERALVSTGNLTRKCLERTRDFMLLSSDPAIVAGVVAMFRADSTSEAYDTATEDGRLIVGPGSSRARIEALLAGARRSIRIMDHKLSDAGIRALLRDRRRNGVSVQIERGDPMDPLIPHGRLIVIDHDTAVVGSFSLSPRSLDERRELAVIIRNPELVAKLDRQFEKVEARRAESVELAA